MPLVKNMAAVVILKDLAEALEMQFDEHLSFLDFDTGRIETGPLICCAKRKTRRTTTPTFPMGNASSGKSPNASFPPTASRVCQPSSMSMSGRSCAISRIQ